MNRATFRGLVTLTRPDLSLSAGVCVVLGQLLACGKAPAAELVLAGFWSVAFISAAILVMNDRLDYRTDCINAPHRPIPSGLVSPQQASYGALVLFAAGLFISFLLSTLTFLTAILLSGIGALYNWKLKNTGLPGNLLVSFSVGMTFIYGGISTGNMLATQVWFFAILTALVDLGEEICADAMDVAGDSQTGSRSLAVRYSPRLALQIGSSIFLLVVVASVVPFIYGWFKPVYLIPLALMDAVILFSVTKLLTAENTTCRSYLKWIYRSGSLALLCFIIMLLAGC